MQETGASSKYKDLFTAALNKDLLQNCPVSIEEDGRGEPAVDSSQVLFLLHSTNNSKYIFVMHYYR